MGHFKKVYTNNYEVQKIQANVEDTFNELTQSEFIRGNFVTAAIGTGDTVINHLLGRNYEGWTIVDLDANAVIYRSNTQNNNLDRQIILKASAPVNAKIYIF